MSLTIAVLIYVVISYFIGYLIFWKGTTSGCGLDTLSQIVGLFSPIIMPLILINAIRRMFS